MLKFSKLVRNKVRSGGSDSDLLTSEHFLDYCWEKN